MPSTANFQTSGSSVSMPKGATIECSARTPCSAPRPSGISPCIARDIVAEENSKKISGVFLSPPPPVGGGEGGGVGGLSALIAVSITERTPDVFSKTSLFQNLKTQ